MFLIAQVGAEAISGKVFYSRDMTHYLRMTHFASAGDVVCDFSAATFTTTDSSVRSPSLAPILFTLDSS